MSYLDTGFHRYGWSKVMVVQVFCTCQQDLSKIEANLQLGER